MTQFAMPMIPGAFSTDSADDEPNVPGNAKFFHNKLMGHGFEHKGTEHHAERTAHMYDHPKGHAASLEHDKDTGNNAKYTINPKPQILSGSTKDYSKLESHLKGL